MKIYSISDLHLSLCGAKPMDIFGESWDNYLEKIKEDWLNKVTENDIVLLCGDLSWAMKLEEVLIDIQFLNELPGTKIIIKGNHDYWWNSLSKIKSCFPKNIIPLQNDSVKIGNYIICGTRGWTVPENLSQQTIEDKKIYDREVLRLELSLKNAISQKSNNETIVAITHFPPFNSKIENSDFTKLFEKYGVCKVVFGHLHGKKARVKNNINKNGVSYVLTSCDLVENKLIEIF